MAVALAVMGVLVLIMVYITVAAVRELQWVRDDLQNAADREHAKCIGAVMKFIGDEYAAQVLTVAADDYASAEAHNDLDRISRLVYSPGGPPVPALWLYERAERLRIMADKDWSVDLEVAHVD